MRERATKRKLPFTVGANGEQKDSDTGTRQGPLFPSLALPGLTLNPWKSLAVAAAPAFAVMVPPSWALVINRKAWRYQTCKGPCSLLYFPEVHTEQGCRATRTHGLNFIYSTKQKEPWTWVSWYSLSWEWIDLRFRTGVYLGMYRGGVITPHCVYSQFDSVLGYSRKNPGLCCWLANPPVFDDFCTQTVLLPSSGHLTSVPFFPFLPCKCEPK